MKNNKISLTLFVISLLMLVGCSNHITGESNTANASWAYDDGYEYERFTSFSVEGYPWIRASIEEIARGATHIVKAEVLDSRVELINTWLSDTVLSAESMELFYLPHTIHRLRVIDVFKGEVAIGDIIEVAQEGGRIGNRELIDDMQVNLTYGDDLIFFLHCYTTRGFSPQPMVLESSRQAIYWPAPPDSGLGVVLENFSSENNLTLTVGDLERFAMESGLRPTPSPSPRPTSTPGNNNQPSTTTPPGGSEEQEPESTPQPTTSPTPQPTPDSTSPTPAPEDTTEAEAAPVVLLRFEIGSLYYTNHEGTVLLGDAAPFITGNRAHVPLRIIAEALGAEVTWNRATRTGYMAKGDTVVSIVVNQPLPDGMGMPVIINNRTMVPARYISETFGAEVRWDRDNAAVYVYMPR